MSACQLVGQLTMGYLGDMISKRLILHFCMLGHGAAGVLLGIADSYLLDHALFQWSTAWPGARGDR